MSRDTSKHTDLTDLLSYFKPNRLPDVYNVPESYMSYIFMTRPDINIMSGPTTPNPKWATLESYADHLQNPLNREICRSLTRYSSSEFIPWVTHKARGYQIEPRVLKTIEKGMTYLGNSISYGTKSVDHKKVKNITLEFTNDRFLTPWRLHAAWRDYIDIVSFRSNFGPEEKYIYPLASLDYGASIYYIVTKRDGRSIIYWEKLYGVFPISVPDDIFNSQNNAPIFEPTIQIQYAVSMKSDPNSYAVLEDFHSLCKGSLTPIPLYDRDMRGAVRPRDVMARYPMISKDKNGQFYLDWSSEIKK